MSSELYLQGMKADDLDAYTRDNIWFMLKFSESGMDWRRGHWIDGDQYSGFLRNSPIAFADNPFIHIDTLDVMGQIGGPQKNLDFGNQYLWQIRKDPSSGRYSLYNRRRGAKVSYYRKQFGSQDFPIIVAGNWNPPGTIANMGFFEEGEIDVNITRSKSDGWLWFVNKRWNIDERFTVTSPGEGHDNIRGFWQDKAPPPAHPNQTRYPVGKIQRDGFYNGRSFEVVAIDVSSGVPEVLATGDEAKVMFFDLAEDQDSPQYDKQQARYFYNKCKRVWANGPSTNAQDERVCQMFFANTDSNQRVKFVFEDTKRCSLPDYQEAKPPNHIADDPIFRMACSGLNDGGARVSVEKCASYLSKIGNGVQVVSKIAGGPAGSRAVPPNAYIRTPIGREYCKTKHAQTGESVCAPALKLWAKTDAPDADATTEELKAIKKEMCACFWGEDVKKKIVFTKNPALKTIVESKIPFVADIGARMLNSILANWTCEDSDCSHSSFSGVKKSCPNIQYQVCSQMIQTNNEGEISIRGNQQSTLQCQQQFQQDLGTDTCPAATSGRTIAFMQKDGKNYCCYDDQEIINGKCENPCKPGFIRDPTGGCKCPEGKYDLNGVCTDIPVCKEDEELKNFKCEPKPKPVPETTGASDTPGSGTTSGSSGTPGSGTTSGSSGTPGSGTTGTDTAKLTCSEHSKEVDGKCVCDTGYATDSVTGKCVVIKPVTADKPAVTSSTSTKEEGNFLEDNKYLLIGGGVGLVVIILLIVMVTMSR